MAMSGDAPKSELKTTRQNAYCVTSAGFSSIWVALSVNAFPLPSVLLLYGCVSSIHRGCSSVHSFLLSLSWRFAFKDSSQLYSVSLHCHSQHQPSVVEELETKEPSGTHRTQHDHNTRSLYLFTRSADSDRRRRDIADSSAGLRGGKYTDSRDSCTPIRVFFCSSYVTVRNWNKSEMVKN